MKKKPALRKRSRALWVMCIGFALFSFTGFTRMVDSIVNWHWLNFSGIWPGPWYLVFSGGLWGIAGLTALGWLLLSLPCSRQVAAGVALVYAVTYWIDRLFIGRPEGSLPNYTIAGLSTLLGLLFVFLILRPWVAAGSK